MNTRSIRFRLIGWYAGLLTVVMLLFGAYTHIRLDHFLRAVLQATLEHRAQQIVHDILPEIPQRGEAHVGAEIEKRFAPAINDRFVRVARRRGEVLYVSGAPNDRNAPAWATPSPVLCRTLHPTRTIVGTWPSTRLVHSDRSASRARYSREESVSTFAVSYI